MTVRIAHALRAETFKSAFLGEGERECCLLVLNSVTSTPQLIRHPEPRREEEEEEDEEEDLFVFNDATEGLRAPVVKPGLVTPA